MIGTLLRNRYRIDAKLGEGGMGVVYRAHDSLLQRPVAIKTLSPALFGEEGARRFLREAQSAAKLNHSHIVSIFDAVEEGGQFAIVMELVEGQTLRELLPVPVDRLIEITVQILQGLEYAHAQGIVHRDIKPENIVITKEGVAKLMDFGLARSEGRSRLTQTGMVVGTVAYLAPEQALGGQVDGRSDLYALGAVLYEAVAGRPPFESEDPISVITQHINVPPVAPHWHNPAVPQGLENVILKLLAKDPVRRYQSAREALDALAGVRTAAGVSAAEAAAPGGAPAVPAEKLAGPELVELLGRSPLVGRETELTRLKGLIDQAIAGRGAVVLVSGPLGIGKTRLVEETATYARLRGVAVVTGKAFESAPPYGPFTKALRELARGVDADTLAARMEGFAPDLVALIPDLSRQLPKMPVRSSGSPEDQKNRLFAGVAQFLTSTAAVVPVMLVLDDMHLSDSASAELLNYLARGSELGRVLLTAAFRPDEIPATPAGRSFAQVVHELAREPFCVQIALRPLNEDQVTDLMKVMANHPARPGIFGQRIFRVTEGNPYFIEEVVKGLFEQGTLYLKDGRWSTDFDDIQDYSLMQVPTSVHGAIETRVRNLPDPARQVLTRAAVIGRQFSFDTLLTVTGVDEASLMDRVEEAMRAQLIREVRGADEDVYEFAQPMLRQVLYDAIPRRRRRALHRQVGEALEKLYGRKPDPYLEALAFHFAEAEDPERTLKYSRLAGRKAAEVFAYDDAVQYLQEAVKGAEELDHPAERLELMEELADIQFMADRREEIIRAYEDALQFWKSLPAATNVDGARLCRKLGEIGSRWGHYSPRTREHIAEGLRLLESIPNHPERVKLIIASAFERYGPLRPHGERDYAVVEETAQEGYRLAEAIGSLQDMSASLDALAGMYEETADFSRMLQATERRAPIVEQLGDPQEHIDLHFMLGRAYENLGDYPEALKRMRHVYELASHARRAGYVLNVSVLAARICATWDRWDDAEHWCRLFDETESRIEPRYGHRRLIATLRAMAAATRSDLEVARRQQGLLQAIPVELPARALGATNLQLLAALAIGDYERCRTLLEQGLRLAGTPHGKLWLHTWGLQFACEAREWHYVEELARVLERARGSGGRKFVALNCRSLGIHRREHGRLDEAEALLSEASDLFRVLDCPWDLGKTLRELALLRRAQGRNEDATRLLLEALTHFEALRALPDIERTRALDVKGP